MACHTSLYRYARALSHDPVTAEELVQETYRRALSARKRPEIHTPDHMRPWAFTILRNVWQNSRRLIRREVLEEAPGEEMHAPLEESPEAILTRKLLRSEIIQAIDALPQSLREIIVLREIEGLSYAEIAQVVECPAGTVMSRLARARQMLRKLLIGLAPDSREVER
ncbi:MAG TPA: sigma-70 family RNA polymerase sigma factor [Bryobacteraceae bacterium]|nr:sigma-70 family RNA polymerase sigma factor [Bryobacteraceae bacterium]